MQISRDSNYIISAGDDSTVRVWSVEKRREIITMLGSYSNVTQLAISSDNSFIVFGNNNKIMYAQLPENNAKPAVFKGHH